VELSPSWEAANRSAPDGFPNIYLKVKLKVYYRVHKSFPLLPMLIQVIAVDTTP
jgi:hypothetical protein